MRKLLRLNWLMFACMIALIVLGTMSIWSAGNAREVIFHDMWQNHLTSAFMGLVIYFLLAFTDYRWTVRIGSPFAYGVSIILLVAVLFLGDTVYGGRRWLWFFQPSEIAKLCTIMFLASLVTWDDDDGVRLTKFDDDDDDEGSITSGGGAAKGFGLFALAGAVAGVPALLILAEPDLGTTLALAPAVIVMLVVAGVWRKGLFTAMAIAAVGVSLVLGAVWEAEKPGQSEERREAILRHVPLKKHQVQRVKTFLFPESDPMGAGYNLRQSLIAIGSGGVTGKGFGKGETNRLKYLPPSVSMNDFIFCVYAEETGYVGSLTLLVLFSALCLSGAWIGWRCRDGCGRVLALGVTALIFAHAYINIAMDVGLLPITGLPLPFMSSGRTFLLVVMAGLGLVQSVAIHSDK